MRVAIVYDRVNKWGGAERVLLALHKIFPDAPLYTSVYDEKKASWAKAFPKVYTSFLQKIPLAKGNHELFAFLMPLAFELFNFDEYDLVISVTSEAAKGIITKPSTTHICYCLTPTRYLWSGYDVYFKNPILKFISTPTVAYLRYWDKIAAARPDRMIAISTEVRERIKKYYGRDSEIIFPLVDLSSPNHKDSSLQNYYLVVSRFVPYKRVDLAVRAFNKLGYPLLIVGTGWEEEKLRLIARPNVKFVKQVADEELAKIYLGAKALVMSQEEDFGIVSVEAQSFGVPVIAYKKGGAIDTVIDGKTGIFFNEQSLESLVNAVTRFEKTRFVVDNLYTNAQRFSFETFKEGIKRLI